MSRTEAAGVIIRHGNEILLVKRSYEVDNFVGIWSIPGGGVEKNEIPYEAAIRELYEETQIDSQELTFEDYLGTIKRKGKEDFHIFLWSAERKMVPILDFEHTDYGWYKLSNLPKPMTPEMVEKIFEIIR